MIAYTCRPTGYGPYVHVDGPNGGCTGYDGDMPFWCYQDCLPGGPFMDADILPAGVESVVIGEPPCPPGGWRLGAEIVVLEVCYAGPQWLYKILRLMPGEMPGYSCAPVGRIAYGQRLF